MIASPDPPSGSPSKPPRPRWALRGHNAIEGLIPGYALGATIGRLIYDAFGDRLGEGAGSAGWMVFGIVAVVILGPWLAMRLARRQHREPPPIVPMQSSSPGRRLYRRFGWVPFTPILLFDYAVALGYRPGEFGQPLGNVLVGAMLLGPMAFIYWSGDRHR